MKVGEPGNTLTHAINHHDHRVSATITTTTTHPPTTTRFKGIVEDRLHDKLYKAPWKPDLKTGDKLDDSHFDFFDEDDNVPKYRGDQKIFEAF
jgi:hypothetical protein